MNKGECIKSKPEWRIPQTLNIILVFSVAALSLLLLWAGSNLHDQLQWVVCLGVVYSYLQLTNYALMHEAAHDKLHPNSRMNYLLGLICGIFFPISFTMFHNTHTKHHVQNRNREELFDAYGPDDSIVKKYLQWYGILVGGFWFYPVAGSVLLTIFSPETIQKWFLDDRPGIAYSGGFDKNEIKCIRYELIIFIALFSVIFMLLNLSLTVLLIFYACFAVNWSTRQFIEHAYTKIHFVEGSLNLRHFRWMSKVLLNRELDLNHHRYPDVPWNHLPKLLAPDEPRIHYLKQYMRLWRGPVPLTRLEEMTSNL